MCRKRNILFIGFNKKYHNPNFSVTIEALSSFLSITFYGPGYSNNEDLELGIENWLDKKEIDFDYILCDSFVFEYENIIRRKNRFSGTVIYFNESEYDKYSPIFKNFFLNNNYKKIFISNWDYYNVSTKLIETIINNDIFILGNDKCVFESYDGIITNYSYSDNWFKFCNDYSNKIISSPHFIGMNEFNFTRLSKRKYEIFVPGTTYKARRKAINDLGLKKKKIYWINKLNKFLFYFLMRRPSRNIMDYFNYNFNNLISETKFCFTCGSEFKAPVRKYFEIPSKSTVLICVPFTGMDKLGFKHNINCILVDDILKVKNIIDNYDAKSIQKIADNGRELVLNKHSVHSRSIQWESSFALINQDKFNGSTWKNGEYINLISDSK